LESGNDPEYLVLEHFVRGDQTRRYWTSAGMIVSDPSNSLRRVGENVMTGLNWMSARNGSTDGCLKIRAVNGSHATKLPSIGVAFSTPIPETVRHTGKSTNLRGEFRQICMV